MTTVIRGTLAMAPAIRTVLARGLADDPMMRWLFPLGGEDESRRQGRAALYLMGQVEQLVEQGVCHVARDREEVVGAALWITGPRTPLTTLTSPSDLWSLTMGEQRAAVVMAAFAAAREGGPTGVRPYLSLLAVDPGSTGRGIGRLLVEAGHEAVGPTSWLDSTNARNHSFYERLGYRSVHSAPLGDAGVTLTTMARGL